MAADMPYDREDAAAEEKRRAAARRADRRMAIKNDLRRAASILPRARRSGDDPPLTERVTTLFSVGDRELIERTARELGVSVRQLLRGAALIVARRLEGRL